MIFKSDEMFEFAGIGENGLPRYEKIGETITLTPDQYSIVDEPKQIPEKDIFHTRSPNSAHYLNSSGEKLSDYDINNAKILPEICEKLSDKP